MTGGSLNGSTFVRSGQDTAVEVLHITNPQAGAWQIHLTAPKGMSSQLVSATAFWQGAVRVSIVPSHIVFRSQEQVRQPQSARREIIVRPSRPDGETDGHSAAAEVLTSAYRAVGGPELSRRLRAVCDEGADAQGRLTAVVRELGGFAPHAAGRALPRADSNRPPRPEPGTGLVLLPRLGSPESLAPERARDAPGAIAAILNRLARRKGSPPWRRGPSGVG